MKKALLCLIAPFLLASCSFEALLNNTQQNNDNNPDGVVPADNGGDTTPDVEVTEADILLEDGTKQHLTNEKLTEEQYRTLTNSLVKANSDFNYDLNIKKYQSKDYNCNVSGIYSSVYCINYTSETEFTGYEYDLWTGKVNKSEYVYASDKYMDPNSGIMYARNTHYTRFFTYDGELECGKLEYINGLSNGGNDYEEWITYQNPNKPGTFPTSNPSSSGIKTTTEEHDVLYSFVENMMHRRFLPRSGSPSISRILSTNANATHSHRLTSKYLIIDETIAEGSDGGNEIHHWDATYYYELSTGKLDKVKTDFEIYNSNGFVGLFSGDITENYRYSQHEDLKKEVHDQMDRFLSFDGVQLTNQK